MNQHRRKQIHWGDFFCFQRGAIKDIGTKGWADVWKRHHFAWEYKGKGKSHQSAIDQLIQYALALENPPLLVVSDMVNFQIRTNWTNTVSETHEFKIYDLVDTKFRNNLKWTFSGPHQLKPVVTR